MNWIIRNNTRFTFLLLVGLLLENVACSMQNSLLKKQEFKISLPEETEMEKTSKLCYNFQDSTVYCITHSHMDFGWLQTVEEYYKSGNILITKAVSIIFPNVLRWLRQNPARIFSMEHVGYFEYWATYGKKQEIDEYLEMIAQGRIEILNPSITSPDGACTHYEDLITNLRRGTYFLKKVLKGKYKNPKVAWFIDDFGHSAELARIYKNSGAENMLIVRVSNEEKEQRMKKRDMDLKWSKFFIIKEFSFEDTKSSKIFEKEIQTHILGEHYSTDRGMISSSNWLRFVKDVLFNFRTPKSVCEKLFDHFKYFLKGSTDPNAVMVLFGDDFFFKKKKLFQT